MQLEQDGAERFAGLILPNCVARLVDILERTSGSRPGIRLSGSANLSKWLQRSALRRLIDDRLGPKARPVRAILFDKNPEMNWSLGWHQDRTIAVAEKVDSPGFGPWSVKAGITHVEPPFDLLERMLTARIHLDEVDSSNAPLLVAPGSHRLGRQLEGGIDQILLDCGTAECLASVGDVWLYATSIIHSSARSSGNRRRRVLQVDYSADVLPPPLQWKGLD